MTNFIVFVAYLNMGDNADAYLQIGDNFPYFLSFLFIGLSSYCANIVFQSVYYYRRIEQRFEDVSQECSEICANPWNSRGNSNPICREKYADFYSPVYWAFEVKKKLTSQRGSAI